jgi:uncharacterized membrane protein
MLDSLVLGALALNVLAWALVIARGVVFRTRVYRPMLLNLTLSAVPLVVLFILFAGWVALLSMGVPRVVSWVFVAVCVLVWLLMLPNAAYLITELNLTHRKPGENVPEWYDVLLVLVLAMSGVLNTVLNVFVAQFAYCLVRFGDEAAPLGYAETRVIVGVVLLLVSFGVWLGRNVRVNSWDVLRPWRLAVVIWRRLSAPGVALSALAFTLIAAMFFATMYLVVAGPVIQNFIDVEVARR